MKGGTMNKATNTKRRLIGILLAAAALVPATAQAGPDFPDGRISLNRATVQTSSDYPDGRMSPLAALRRAEQSVTAPTTRPLGDAASGLWPDGPIGSSSPPLVVTERGFDWADAAIGAVSTLGFVALLMASTLVARRRVRFSA
jgi:hypothetical protein